MPGHFSATIDYNELKGSSEHDFSLDKPTSKRVFLVDWDHAFAFASELTGRTNVVSRGWMQVFQPKTDPERSFLVCTKCRVSGLGTISTNSLGTISYHMAKVDADFEMRPQTQTNQENKPTPESITFVTEKSSGTTTVITVPGDRLQWKSGTQLDKPVGEEATAAIIVPGKSISYDIQYWFAPPIDEIYEAQGKLNNFTITILGKTYKKETLILMNPSFTRQFTSEGVSAYQASLQLNWRRQTWQTLYCPADQKWCKVATSDGDKPYEIANFQHLFPRGFV